MLGNLNKEQIEDVLHGECISRIGCREGDNVQVVPVTHAYVGGTLYCHSAEGRKIRLLRQRPHVCVESGPHAGHGQLAERDRPRPPHALYDR